MTVIEHAKQLGEAIAKDEVLQKFNAAKKAYEENLELQHFVFEYNTQRTILGNEFRKELNEQNEELIKLVRAKTDELFKAITEHEIYKDFIKAQEAVNKLMNDVNSEINFYVFGERPCTHDCSTCSSACSEKK